MNKGLAQFLLVVGIAALAWGGYSFASNQPREFKPSQDQTLGGAMSDIGNALTTPFENIQREKARRTAVNIMVAGGIVAIIGLVGMGTGKKSSAS
ncbi:MAG: hypothetical protein HZC42_04000 [Candidatus Eisenbacteria bacterium]|nr:hypothetical protein [Candidatus Eisenbacteria bacterium]